MALPTAEEGYEWVPVETATPAKSALPPAEDGYEWVPAGGPPAPKKKPGFLETVWDYASEIGRQTEAGLINLVKGQSSVRVAPAEQDPYDQYLDYAAKESKKFQEKHGGDEKLGLGFTKSDFTQAATSAPFSIVGMAASAPVALLSGPAAPAVGLSTSLGTIYRMDSAQIMHSYLSAINDAAIERDGKPLTKEEEQFYRNKFSADATKHGLWEAIPEAISDVSGLGMLTKPLKSVFGKHLATRMIGKLGTFYGMELGTETISQQGEQPIEVKAGLSEGPERSLLSARDWWTSAKEIAGPTVIQTSVMGLIGGGAHQYSARKKAIGLNEVADGGLHKTMPDKVLEATVLLGEDTVEARPWDKKLKSSVAVLNDELAIRKKSTTENATEVPESTAGADADVPPGTAAGGPPSRNPDALTPEFFQTVQSWMANGQDNEGNPFTVDEAAKMLDAYKRKPGADPASVQAFEGIIGKVATETPTQPLTETVAPSPVQDMPAIAPDIQALTTFRAMLADNPNLATLDISEAKSVIATQHPHLIDELNKAIIEHKGSKLNDPTWTGTLTMPFETPEMDLSGIPRVTPVKQTTVTPPQGEIVQTKYATPEETKASRVMDNAIDIDSTLVPDKMLDEVVNRIKKVYEDSDMLEEVDPDGTMFTSLDNAGKRKIIKDFSDANGEDVDLMYRTFRDMLPRNDQVKIPATTEEKKPPPVVVAANDPPGGWTEADKVPKPGESKFKKGDRIVLEDGRHGEVTKVSSFTMRPIFGTGKESTTHTYEVTTDQGSKRIPSESQMTAEKERPTEPLAPDIAIDGKVSEPEHVADLIHRAKKRAVEHRAAAGRAKLAANRNVKLKNAQDEEAYAAKLQKIFDDWKAQNPEAAEKFMPMQAKADETGKEPAKPGKNSLADLGIDVTKGKTNNGKDVWNVSGNTKEHSEGIKRAGGRWYGPKRVWSFYNGDPTEVLLEKLGITQSGKTVEQLEAELKKGGTENGQVQQTETEVKESAVNDNAALGQKLSLLRRHLERGGSGRIDNVDYSIHQREGNRGTATGYYWRIVREGVRTEKGSPPNETSWDRLKAIDKLAEEARFILSTPNENAVEETGGEGKEAPKASFGSENKLFTEDKANKAREILRKKLAGLNMGVPLDPEIIQAGIDLAGYYIEGGSRSFAEYSKKMIIDLGDVVRPYLKSFYMAVRNYPGFDKTGMNNEAEVDKIDENAIDISEKEGKLESKGGENNAGRDGETARGSVVARSPGLDAAQLPGEDAGALSDEEVEGISGQEGNQRPGKERGTGKANGDQAGGKLAAGESRPDRGSDKGESDSTAGRPGNERQPAGTVTAVNDQKDHAVVGKRLSSGANHRIGPDDTLFHSGKVSRINANVRAIQTLIKLEKEDRTATDEEKKILAQFTGWGAVAQDVFNLKFDNYVRKYRGQKTRGWDPAAYKYVERDYLPSDVFSGKDLEKYEEWEIKYGSKLHPALGGLLSESEWKAAQDSALNAHYTDRGVIEAMWSIAERLGFKGGKVLEPGAGVGHFFGLMPENLLNNSKLTGIELDPVTGRILGKLYADADIQVTGFETAKRINDNSFDIVISNFPFGNYPVNDKKHPAYSGWSVHNYFFARSIDAVKPGGLVISVTSHFSMDAIKDGKYREYLAGKADLIGAIRLPGTAFEKNAGTSVTTDILIFRKKSGTEYPNPQNWRLSLPVKSVEGDEVKVNEYFINNPQMVLGQHSTKGKMHADKKEYTLLPSTDGTLKEQIEKATDLLPRNIATGEIALSSETEAEEIRATDAHKEGTFTVHKGKVYMVDNGALKPAEFAEDAKKMSQAVAYVGVRDSRTALIDLMQSEEATDKEIATAQADLNKKYDAYVKKYGNFHKRGKDKFLEEDDEFPTVLSLETVENYYVAGVKTPFKKILKDDIFTTRTVYPFVEPKTAENIEDAMRLSVTYRNGVDLDYISSLLGMAKEDARSQLLESELAYEDPATGIVESREAYLSGNVREKMKLAEANGLEKNAAALKKVLPAFKYIDEVHYKIGSEWMPPDIIEAFISNVMGANVEVRRSAVELADDASTSWAINAPRSVTLDRTAAVYTQWGAEGLSGIDLIEDALNLKRPEVFDHYVDENGNEKRTKNNEKTVVAQQKQKEIVGYWEGDRLVPGAFRDYVMQHPEHITRIEQIFNESANNYVVRQYDTPTFAHFPNASHAIKLRAHQMRAVIRGLIDKGVVYAHAVGTGKTYMYSSLAMELKRIKRARKPMIVVQGSTLKQFAAQAHKLYPTARILTLAKEEISGPTKRQAMMAKVANGNWDMVIIAHSTFNRISVDPYREAAFIEEQLEEIEAAIRAEGGDVNKAKREDSMTVKELRKLLKRKRERLEKLADRSQDNAVSFESLGVDALLIDEAHTYKRGDFFTKMGNIRGLDRGAAQKSFDFMMKCRYVQEKAGGKNVYLATGTPVSNTIAEVWTLLRYARPELLREYGVSQFDGFASLFGDTRVAIEPTETGEYKVIERFNKYSNGVQLINMWLSGADVILQEDVPGWADMVPKLKNGEFTKVTLPRPASLDAFIEDIRRRKAEWEELPGREKVAQRHVPIVLYGEAKKGSIDLRLVHPENVDDPGSKVNKAVNLAFKKWQDTKEDKGTQLIFCDLYQSPDPDAKKWISKDNHNLGKVHVNPHLRGIPRFNLYEDIKRKLVAKGIPEAEIAIINESKYSSDSAKEKLFERVNDGAVRFVLGSTEKLGVGVNVQERLAHVIHIDAPGRPMDFEQRNGRILRPGNGFKEVEVTLLATVNSMDEVSYTRLQKKQKFTNQLLRGNIPGNNFEDPSDEVQMTLEQMIAVASGNPLVMKQYELENNIRELETLKHGHEQKTGLLRHSIPEINGDISRLNTELRDTEKKIAEIEKAIGKSGAFKVKIGDKKYDDEAASVEALSAHIEDVKAQVAKLYNEKLDEIKKELAKRLEAAKDVKTGKGEAVSGVDLRKVRDLLRSISSNGDKEITLNGIKLDIKVSPDGPTSQQISFPGAKLAAFDGAADPISTYRYGTYFDNPWHAYKTAKGILNDIRKNINELYDQPVAIKQAIEKKQKNKIDMEEEIKKPFPHTERLENLRREYSDVLSQLGTAAATDVQAGDEVEIKIEETPDIEKYYVKVKDGFKEAAGATPVDNEYGLDLFVFNEGDMYTVHERSTGLSAATGRTKIGAIESALQRLETEGTLEKVKDTITEKIEAGDMSPWYKATQEGEGEGTQYSMAADQTPEATIEDVKAIFKGQEVVQPGGANSPIYVKTRGGKYLTIETVSEISENEVDFQMSYGEKFDRKTMQLAGAYGDGVARLVRGIGGRWTLAHESMHFLEDTGIIDSGDVASLKGHIKGLVRDGKYETANKKDIGGAEDRANFLADALTKDTTPKGLIGRIIARIREFIDRLVNAFGKRTAAGVVRDVKSGRIFDRETTEAADNLDHYSVEKKGPEKSIIAFKLFRTLKGRPGEIFPLFIGKNIPTPIGKWVSAEFLPTKGFAYRPGWHVGRIPRADHLMKKDGTLPSDRVWAEVEIPADRDWQGEADKQATKDIQGQVPEGGYYRFRRPVNQGGEWLIAGSMKVNRILSEQDVEEILASRPPEVGGQSVQYSVQKIVNSVEKYVKTKISDAPGKDASPSRVNSWIKDETDAILQTLLNKLPGKLPHMTMLEKALKSPEWFAHPVFNRIVRLFVRDRNEIYHEYMNYLHNIDDPFVEETTISEAGTKLKHKGLTWSQIARGQASKDYQDLLRVINEGDTSWVRNKKKDLKGQIKEFEEHIRKQGVSEDTIAVWKLHRESYDRALDMMTAQMRQMLEAIEEEAAFRGIDPADYSEMWTTLKGAIAQMETWKGFYAPRIRKPGNWVVQASRGPEGFKEHHREHRGSELAARRLAKQLEREGWDVKEPFERNKIPEEVYGDIKQANVAKAIENALEGMKKGAMGKGMSEATIKFNEELLQEVADMIRMRGYRSSMIHRKQGQGAVTGFIEDPMERHVLYINNVARGMAKAQVARAAINQLMGNYVNGKRIGGIDPARESRVYTAAQDYIEEQLRNLDQTDRVIGWAKSLATFKFLGFNARSALVNTTSMVTTAPPAIHEYVGKGKVGFMRINREIAKAGKDYALFMRKKEIGNVDEMRFLEEEKRLGWDDPQYTRDALGQINKIQNRAWALTMQGAMAMFGTTEKWNRGATMLAAYRIARKVGNNHEEAMELAKNASDKAHGIYGRATLPSVAWGTNPAAKLAQMLYVYGKFSHNYLQMLYDLGFKKHNFTALIYGMIAPIVIGGGAAIPFKDLVFWPLIGMVLSLAGLKDKDEDPEKWFWDVTRKYLGKGYEVAGRYGLFGAIGMDLSGSLSIGVGIPKDAWEWAGAIGGVAKEGKMALHQAGLGNYGRAAEHLLPTGIANFARARREAKQGLTTEKGKRVWDESGKPYMPTTAETLLRMGGFRSSKQAMTTERLYEGKDQAAKYAERRQEIYERYRVFLAKPDGERDMKEHKQIREDVRNYNDNIKKHGLKGEGVSLITFESMRRQAQSMRHATKNEKRMMQ